MAEAERRLTEAARRALRAWDLDGAEIELHTRSENTVFRVTASGARQFALRLHRPGYNTLDELHSEQLWTGALLASGIAIPPHVPTRTGAGYTAVALEGAAEPVQAGMIEWLPGDTMASLMKGAEHNVRVAHFESLGRLMATLHDQANAWPKPAGFTRRIWDADGLVGTAPLWGRFWETPQLTDSEAALFAQTRQRLHELLLGYSKETDGYGLIHADLHPNNVLVDGDRLQIIDFDDCGFGWHVYDLAVALYHFSEEPEFAELSAAMVRGYRTRRALSDELLAQLPVFLLVRALLLIGWVNDRPEHLDVVWLRERIEVLCDQIYQHNWLP